MASGRRTYWKVPPATFLRFAAGDSAIHYLVADGAGQAIMRYEYHTGTLHAPVTLPDFQGPCVGMTAGRGDEVWLLNDAGVLSRVDGLSGRTLAKSRVATADSLRGLAHGE